MSLATEATRERWAIERAARQAVAREIAEALEQMAPLWMANTASMGDGIDQKAAARIAREIGGVS